MVSPGAKQRLKDLADNIAKDQELLKDYEEALSVEDEPRRIKKYRREIERQRESIQDYPREYYNSTITLLNRFFWMHSAILAIFLRTFLKNLLDFSESNFSFH